MPIRKISLCVTLLLAFTFMIQKASGSEPSTEIAARQLLNNQVSPEILEDMYIQVSNQVALGFQAEIQPTLNRAISDSEKQRLQLFWYKTMKELMPYSALEDMLTPVITKHLTYEDLSKINEFYSTPVGKKLIKLLPLITREAEAAGEELGRKLKDSETMNKIMEDMKLQFPQWFPSDEN